MSSEGQENEEEESKEESADEEPTADTVAATFINYVVSDVTEIVFVEAGELDTAKVTSIDSGDCITSALDVEFAGFDE